MYLLSSEIIKNNAGRPKIIRTKAFIAGWISANAELKTAAIKIRHWKAYLETNNEMRIYIRVTDNELFEKFTFFF
jgi:hypothetical protein